MKMLTFKKVSLLGWSDGGITALIAAARYPSYINKMVIWGANAYVTDQDEEIYQGNTCGVNGPAEEHEVSCHLFIFRLLLCLSPPASPPTPSRVFSVLCGAVQRPQPLDSTLGVCLQVQKSIRDVSKWSERTRKPLEALYGFDYFARTCEKWVDGIKQFKHLPDGNICRHLLPLVQCPTLIVHGEKDPLVPSFHADFIHKHVKGSRLHLMPEGKHNLHLRFADEFNKLVEDFLQ
ncbi:hypothetical protein J1605_004588 [Eschrichtius robustus]|uniref:Valacyclovir hydrolase n=1 Tax=Eschrichtius robustus TaxID=9764 RepID=A0AB34HHY9_ESCRO|nr:hypothetical protein J1605_004588 [Eschrichtius robustus]